MKRSVTSEHWFESSPLCPSIRLITCWGRFPRIRRTRTWFALYKEMNGAGIRPDLCTLNILINCWCHLEMIKCGFGVFAEIVSAVSSPTRVTLATLLKGLCLVGKAIDAVEMFDNWLSEDSMVLRGRFCTGCLLEGSVKLARQHWCSNCIRR
ncbi:uncharacterized protein J3R85_001627 [Psidium guajava]|nr:uncharacterized protein J3R85_001627 [Psidium guajava]